MPRRPNRPGGSTCAAVLALALATPRHAFAEPAEDDAGVTQARELHAQGRARYETLDYEGAIELWTRAYANIPAKEAYREIRNELVYNIATAREKAYDVDGDIKHLKRAKGLLEKYLAEFKTINEPTDANRHEAARVQKRLTALDEKIAEVEGGEASAPAPTPATPELTPQQRAERLLATDPVLRKKHRSGRGMIIAGSITLGVGLVVLSSLSSSGVRGDVGTGAGAGVLGGGLVITGLVLIPVGAKRFKAAKREARARVVMAPTLHPAGGGLQAIVRF